MANFAQVASTIRTTFNTNWTALNTGVPLYFIDQEPDLDTLQDTTFLRLSIIFGESSQVAMGGGSSGRRVRTVGSANIQVFQPNGLGDGQLYRLADSIASVWQVSTISGIIYRATSAQNIQRDGPWIILPVFTPFYSDEYVT